MDDAALEDLFAPAGRVLIRRMFGGKAVYSGERIIALEIRGTVYLKADSVSAPAFEDEGLEAFGYVSRGKRRELPYRRIPDEAFEDPDVLRHWFRLAVDASIRTIKPPKVPRRPKVEKAPAVPDGEPSRRRRKRSAPA